MAVQLYDFGIDTDYIPIDVSKVPCVFSIKLAGKTFTFTILYNEIGRFFTADLQALDGTILSFGDPVRYGRPLFGSVEDERFPYPVIIPYCLTGSGVDTVTFENFGKEVKLYLIERWT